MNGNSQLGVAQSTTTNAKCEAPTATTPPQIPSKPNMKGETNTRLELYKSLFGHGTNKGCEKTGLNSNESLNYSLYTFLHLCDIHWVLAVIDVNDFDAMNEKYGQHGAKRKMDQIATVIQNFCQNDTRKLKGYRYKRNGNNNNNSSIGSDEDHDLFAMLMHCHPQINISHKYISKLIERIEQQTNEKVSVGIAKMNEWETFEEWKQRAIKNMQNSKNGYGVSSNAFYSDIDVKYLKPMVAGIKTVAKLGSKEEFDKKMQEIANNENYDWVVAMMQIDDFDSFVFLNNNNQEIIKTEVEKIETEMSNLFDIYGNGMHTKYFGYNLSTDGSKIGMVLYDSKDSSKCLVPAHDLLEALKEEINSKSRLTVSIGCSRLNENDLGMSFDWYERVKRNLAQARKNGKNSICYGNGKKNENEDTGTDRKESKCDQSIHNSVNFDAEADKIEKKSLQVLEKYGFAAAIKLGSAKIVVNNGNLVNENDVKIDVDPTTGRCGVLNALSSSSDITFKQIYGETQKFVKDNKRYMKYPKLFINSVNPQCNETYCKQCNIDVKIMNDNDKNSNVLSLCEIKRREMANALFKIGETRNCLSDSLTETMTRLCMTDSITIYRSKKYDLVSNWFVKTFSLLKWQQEMIRLWMRHLVHFDRDNNVTNEIDHSVHAIAMKFELLMLIHSYLGHVIKYLVLFYCSVDENSWISVFYPFIERVMGHKQCSQFFARMKSDGAHVHSNHHGTECIFGSVLKANAEYKKSTNIAIDKEKEKILNEMKGLSIIVTLFYGMYDGYQFDNQVLSNLTDSKDNPFNLVNKINIKLNEMIDNIKTQLTIETLSPRAQHRVNKEHYDHYDKLVVMPATSISKKPQAHERLHGLVPPSLPRQNVVTIKCPLVIALCIADYNKELPLGLGWFVDYTNVQKAFNVILGYDMIFMDAQNKLIHLTNDNQLENKASMIDKDSRKINWTEKDITVFHEKIFENIFKNDKFKGKYDGLIYYISGHGDDGDILHDSDVEEIPMATFYQTFNSKNCPYLAGKPKIWFNDVERGSTRIKQVKVWDDNEKKPGNSTAVVSSALVDSYCDIDHTNRSPVYTSQKMAESSLHHEMEDLRVVNGTVPGCHLEYGSKRGSYLIRSIAELLEKLENDCDLSLNNLSLQTFIRQLRYHIDSMFLHVHKLYGYKFFVVLDDSSSMKYQIVLSKNGNRQNIDSNGDNDDNDDSDNDDMDGKSQQVSPKITWKPTILSTNPLIVILAGVGFNKDNLEEICSTKGDYLNILLTFHKMCGYDVVYQTNKNEIVHLCDKNMYNKVIKESAFKLWWELEEAEQFNDWVNFNLKSGKLSGYDGLIYIVSANGTEHDGLSTELMSYLFGNQHCQDLQSLPKIFVWDTSRGTGENKGFNNNVSNDSDRKNEMIINNNVSDENYHHKVGRTEKLLATSNCKPIIKSSDFQKSIEICKSKSDECYIFATADGYSRLKVHDPAMGNYLIRAFCQSFIKDYGWDKDYGNITCELNKLLVDTKCNVIRDLKYREKMYNISHKDKEAPVIVHRSTIEYDLKFGRKPSLSWQQERIVWVGFYKNLKNKKCLIGLLPKDIVICIIKFLKTDIRDLVSQSCIL